MKRFIGASLMLAHVLDFYNPAMGAEKTSKEQCLRSVEEYMLPKEAKRFCSQPEACRKWWDDLSEKEQEELQPPLLHENPDWWNNRKHMPLWRR